MSNKLTLKLSLVFCTWLCVAPWMAGVYANVGPIKSCCLQLSQTRVHPNNVVDYTVQTTVLCPIDAIVSVHYNNISYTAVGKVDEARMIKIEEEEGKERETVTKGPAVPRKHGKGQKKGKGKENGGKRGGKRNGRGRKRTGRLTGNLDVRSKRWTSASRRLSQ
uniref:Chemokine interleukin-8-like domain-containing protein n=1 Tax=Oncorhynchus mykiss TaxID=8022 RepID=A0A8C7M627_ONCMY